MQPSNQFRIYEVIVLLLVAANTGITTVTASAPSLGITVPPLVALCLIVASAVIGVVLNRMDAFGAPQGNQILFNLPPSAVEAQPPVVQSTDVVIPPGTPRVDGEAGLVAQSKFRADKRE
jgi:hypothetical protein